MTAFSESIGIVLSTVGKVVAKQGAKERSLSRGSPIYNGDTLVTSSAAHAQIKYKNGAIVSIDASSQYQTVNYAPKGDVVIKSSLKSGSISYDSNNKTHKKSIVKTPVVALAILGTQVNIKANSENTDLKVTKGEVCVENLTTNKVEQPCLGPEQSLVSGTFGRNGKFTPGESSALNITHQTAVSINETVTQVAAINTVNSAAQSIQQLTTVAEIVIVNIG